MHTYNVYINGEWHTKKTQLFRNSRFPRVNFVLFKPESNILKVFQHLIKVYLDK